MALFPLSFLEDLKTQTDIVSVIGEVTPLKKAGATWKGLCPFHQEKTPSFNVSPDKGFFKCFGCGVGGDVVKFVELHYKLPFPEAVRLLATRASMIVPETDAGPEQRAATAERDALLRLHEAAAAFFIEQLATPAGARARRELDDRSLASGTLAAFRYGYAPAGGRDTLHARFAASHVPLPIQLKSGLVMQRDDGRIVDRFRNRLMIPIARDTGPVIAFGGRALEPDQVPKYLNSPETPIYTKGRTLYGLDVTKAAIRTHNYCVLVEGYFDLAQVWQAGVQAVAALCGTALTPAQAKTLKRFTSKAVLSLDPDAAGQVAAARSSELLVAEGFQVNVAVLPAGSDPDTFIRRAGAQAYRERLTGSQPYLEFLLDRESAGRDLTRPADRKQFLDAMLAKAALIPDAAVRDQFADRLAHKARITESVVRDEIRRAAAQKKTQAPAIALTNGVRLRPAELGLLWTLMHHPVEGLAAVAQLDTDDLDGLVAGSVLRLAASLADVPPDALPGLLRERLSEGELALVEKAEAMEVAAAPTSDCVNAVRRLRLERDRALVQDEIERLQQGTDGYERKLAALFDRKMELQERLGELTKA
ncbi:MAG: DNA primase [Vicinamibacterales bacterium]